MIWFIAFFNYGSNYENKIAFSGSEDLFKWLALILATAYVVFRIVVYRKSRAFSKPTTKQFILLLPFIAFTTVSSIYVSYVPSVSLMKLFTFSLGTFVALEIPRNCRTEKELTALHSIFASFLVVISFGSLISLPFPISYSTNGLGFQGILNQPQALGIMLSAIAIYLLGVNRLVPAVGNLRIHQAAAAVAIFLMPLTLARTALVALACGMMSYLLYSIWRGQFERTAAAVTGVIILLSCILAGADGGISSKLLFKQNANISMSIGDEFSASRGEFVSEAFENISNRPMTGIGFGLPSVPAKLVVHNDPIFDLPVSAPVEKGFSFLALLEETGGIGFCLLVGALLLMLRSRMLMSIAMPMQLFITVLATNFGESTLFSLGGLGFLFWLFIGLSSLNGGSAVVPTPNRPVARWQ